MSSLPQTLHTAGKITVITSLAGVAIFLAVFFLNLGADELHQANAQGTATTSITVLNTPPAWTVDAEEEVESSTLYPTNSGDEVSWVAIGTDSNDAPYFLLVCDTAASPTPKAAADFSSLGTAAPECAPGSTQWAVSTGTVSGTQARAATTTLEAWSESNDWYAWICDDDPVNPRCNDAVKQGTGTTSSPFYVNHRPSFTVYSDDSPKLPGETVTFTATASDADTTGTADTVKLIVCGDNTGFDTVTNTCNGPTLATSSFVASDPTATYTITIPTRDTNYFAYGHVIDQHGHNASGGAEDTDSVLTVSNATPYVNAGDITLNGSSDITLTVPAGETTGFTLDFLASDNNSCKNAVDGDEIVNYNVSVYRNIQNSTSTCDTAGEYDANDCYTSTAGPSTWNLSCTASSTTCIDENDLNVLYECTFPLWYIADPTFETIADTPYFASEWVAAAAPIDDDGATGVLTEGSSGKELLGLVALGLDTLAIPYGALEPGERTDPLVASTTVRAIGNVALDELLSGESMCTTYTSSVTCPTSATSTIAESYQVFATSSVTYASAQGSGFILSSTTQVELEVNIPKTKSTSTQETGDTYWGIEVPISITLAGAYTGENTFYGKVSEAAEW